MAYYIYVNLPIHFSKTVSYYGKKDEIMTFYETVVSSQLNAVIIKTFGGERKFVDKLVDSSNNGWLKVISIRDMVGIVKDLVSITRSGKSNNNNNNDKSKSGNNIPAVNKISLLESRDQPTVFKFSNDLSIFFVSIEVPKPMNDPEMALKSSENKMHDIFVDMEDKMMDGNRVLLTTYVHPCLVYSVQETEEYEEYYNCNHLIINYVEETYQLKFHNQQGVVDLYGYIKDIFSLPSKDEEITLSDIKKVASKMSKGKFL